MNETARDTSCAARIPDQLSSRLETFADFARRDAAAYEAQDWDAIDEISDERYEMPLAVELKRFVRIDLSTGGPADWFEVFVDSEGDPERIVYHFADWFDHAEVALEGDEYAAAVDALASFVESALNV